jgi:hypothetical protein
MEDTERPHPADDPTLEPIRAAIRKLPPYPFRCNDDTMQTDYVKGLQACVTPEALREFIARWAPLWTIRFNTEPSFYADAEKSLAEGTYGDADALLGAVAYLRREPENEGMAAEMQRLMAESPLHQKAACVLMPGALIEMSIVSTHFGVPANVAWIQATGLVELF